MMVTQYETLRESATGLDKAGLVMEAQKGDVEAFNQLVLFYQDQIFSLAKWILGDDDAAEDITQNTFLAAYRSLPHFRHGSFRGWLYRIATNACYDEIRRSKRHPVQSLEYEDEAEERLLSRIDLPGGTTYPEKAYERQELEQAVQQAINQLDEGLRAVVVLVDLQNFDYQEAAHTIGIPLGTVKSRLARARLQLRHLLEGVEKAAFAL